MRGTRDQALDGLRGWAALVVCVFHFLPEMFRGVRPELHAPWVHVLLDGYLPVALFFILSGYVLTHSGWHNAKDGVVRLMAKRYPRLMLPILATTLIVAAVMALGLDLHEEAFERLSIQGWGRSTMGFDPSPGGALSFALFWSFTAASATHDYQPFLWTMPYELLGSFMVLAICLAERPGPTSLWILSASSLVLLLVWPIVACFPIGALLALLNRDGRLPQLGAWAAPAVVIALIVNGFAPNNAVSNIAAVTIMLAALSSGAVNNALRHPFSQWLGRLSFPVYLMQWPVLITLTSWLVLGVPEFSLPAVFGIASASLIATLLAAQLFLPVEWGTAWVGRRIGRLVPLRPSAYAPADA